MVAPDWMTSKYVSCCLWQCVFSIVPDPPKLFLVVVLDIFYIFTPIWGRFPFWLIFFKGVETTNHYSSRSLVFFLQCVDWNFESRENFNFCHRAFYSYYIAASKLNMSQKKGTIPKGNVIFQPSMFFRAMLVLGGVAKLLIEFSHFEVTKLQGFRWLRFPKPRHQHCCRYKRRVSMMDSPSWHHLTPLYPIDHGGSPPPPKKGVSEEYAKWLAVQWIPGWSIHRQS